MIPPQAVHASGPSEAGVGRSRRILVVEDDAPIRKALAELLSDEGYLPAVADDGEAALDLLTTEELPDLILLDLCMPVMDGWEFRVAQRRDSRLATIPVVAISADASSKAAAVSADAFLSKPLERTGLLNTIERVLKENAQLRSRMQREQVERMTSLSHVAAGVGHQIDRPLSLVMRNVHGAHGRLQTLQDKSLAPDAVAVRKDIQDVQNTLADSLRRLGRMQEIVRNLQVLSRELDGSFETVQIETLLDESIAIAGSSSQRRARITKQYGQVPAVRGVAGALVQMFLNLLINATEAIAEGSPARNEIVVMTSFDGVHVIVEIADTGRGIAPDMLSQIFDPFFTTKRSSEGTGLGLAISHEIVTMHGGRLVLESEPGRGTVCGVYLPPAAVSELPPSQDQSAALDRPTLRLELKSSDATGASGRAPRPRSLSQAVDGYERELLVSALRAMGNKRTLTAKCLGISRKNLWKKLVKYGLQSRRDSSGNPESE